MSKHLSKHFVVDGSNICYWDPNLSVVPLVRLLIEIATAGDTFFCVFDANTSRNFKSPNDRAAYDQLVQQFPNCFAVATGGIRADEFILALADTDKQKSFVISNDRFRDFEKRYAWVIDDATRLVKGQLMAENLIVPSLDINVSVDHDLPISLEELKVLLPAPKPKVISSPRIPRPRLKPSLEREPAQDVLSTDDGEAPLPKKISLRAFNGHYVTAELHEKCELVANRLVVNRWEEFEIHELPQGKVALRAVNKMFVYAQLHAHNELVADRTDIDDWESFTVTRFPNGKIALKAFNGLYVSARIHERGQLVADREVADSWELFAVLSAA